MPKDNQEIFTRPHRMPVINAFKKAVTGVLETHAQPGKVLELGCGSGFLYRHLLPESLKEDYLGIDAHNDSLKSFAELSPDAKAELGDARNLHFPDSSFDFLIGFSSYPLINLPGAVKEAARILKPGGRLAVFQDSGVGNPNVRSSVYDQMRQVEDLHKILTNRLIRTGFSIIMGEDVLEAALVSPRQEVWDAIPVFDRERVGKEKILFAFSSDLGQNRLHATTLENIPAGLKKVIEDLGNPRILEGITLTPEQEALEYIRMRFLIMQKGIA